MPTRTAKRSTEKQPAESKTQSADKARGAGLRSMWKGAISSGMVTIPVRLYPATTSRDLSLNLLHEKCNSRLKQIRWCPVCNREVPWEEIARGYEYAKGQYVRLTDEDFDK